jgi:hypothetical protein
MSFEVLQERDALPARALAKVAIVGVVVVIAAVIVAARMLGAAGGKAHGATVSKVPVAEEGVVEQSLIDRSDRAALKRGRAQQRLASYGWVDRASAVAHIPIDRAIDLYVATDGGMP